MTKATVKDQIVIMLDSYNLKKWKHAVIIKCIENNPGKSSHSLAALLGTKAENLLNTLNVLGISISEKHLETLNKESKETINKFKND